MKKFFIAAAFIMAIMTMTDCKKSQADSGEIVKPENLAADGHFTAEIMHMLGKVSDPQVSPDGKSILFGVTYTSIEQNKGVRQLFVMDIDGANRRQITHSGKSCSNARWLDDNTVLYLSGGQIYKMPAAGGKAAKVSDVKGGISEFKLSPDCSQLLYVSAVKNHTAPTDVYPDLDKATVRTIDGLMYRHWDHFVEEIPHTFIAPLKGGKLGEGKDILEGQPYELPTEPFGGLEQLSWSPDGSKVAYSCRKLTGIDYAFSTNTDIYLYDVASGECENLTEGMPGYDTEPVISPEGDLIAWCSMERARYEADKVRIFVMDLASRNKIEITADFKYNGSLPVWSADERYLYFASLVEGVQEIWRYDMDAAKMERVTPRHEWFDFDTPTVLADRMITTNQSMMRPSEIVSVSLADGSWKQLTHENDDILAKLEQPTVEERWITTTDGKQMLTWVIYPDGFDASKTYPAILMCLGGPQGTISQSWSTRWNYRLMCSQGYIMVLPNRRGTTAFGQEWCEQISGDYIGQNMQDYLRAADVMLAEPYVGKMAAVGASYGGYSVYYLAGIHQGRFSAFIAHAGIFNEEHMYEVTEEMWFPDWDNGGIARPDEVQAGAPWSDNPVARRHYDNSPHKLIKNWDTPIMVVHGELDYRVPVDQGMAAFNAAQMMGVPSKMLLFPDENHWVLKPQNSVYWHRQFFDWLDRWCK